MRCLSRSLAALAGAATLALLLAPVASAAPTSPGPGGAGQPRDARAAAGIGGGAATSAMWSTGYIAPGVTQTWYWNNANPLASAYQVGFSPTGATASQPCRFEKTRDWYERHPSGERKYVFQVRNAGAISCSAIVLLAQADAAKIGSTSLAPGASQNWYWNIPHSVNYNPTQLVGLVPFVPGTLCSYEVTKTSVRTVHPALREFHFTVKNTGSIYCSTDIYLANRHAGSAWRATAWSNPGDTHHAWWNNANPLATVYLAHATPTYVGPECWMTFDRQYYEQRLHPAGWTEREFHVDVRNIGSTVCQHVDIEFTQLNAA